MAPASLTLRTTGASVVAVVPFLLTRPLVCGIPKTGILLWYMVYQGAAFFPENIPEAPPLQQEFGQLLVLRTMLAQTDRKKHLNGD